jgi:death-on-curing protein
MIKYLTLEEVLEMHDAFIEKFGGLKGVRDVNLLLSAIEIPMELLLFSVMKHLKISSLKLQREKSLRRKLHAS